MSENLGMKVTIFYAKTSALYHGSGYIKGCIPGTILRNVTEIHYDYNHNLREQGLKTFQDVSIAFESDIHQTGMTYYIKDIAEFKTELETEKSEDF